MKEMYPEPPHLLISVYVEGSEAATYAQVCDVVENSGFARTGLLDQVPRDVRFTSVSDAVVSLRRRRVSGEEWERLVHDAASGYRVVRCAFSSRALGEATVEYLPAREPDFHPFAVAMDARELGFPDFIWSGPEDAAARARARLAGKILHQCVSRLHVLYGSISVESALWSPSLVEEDMPGAMSELFFSRELLHGDGGAGRALKKLYPRQCLQEGSEGIFCTGWAPFTPGGSSVADLRNVARGAVRVLSRALSAR